MKNINWKKFILAIIISLPALLLLDIAYDKIFKELDFKETFALKNLTFKFLTAIVIGYFYSTLSNTPKE